MKSNNPKISIVIINHNGANFLTKYLPHVLKTDYQNFDIILVDNGSTDNSVKIIRNFEKFFKNMIHPIFLEKNVGPCRARNIGVKKSNSEIIAFLDNDARPDLFWLKKGLDCMMKHNAAVIQCKLMLEHNPNLIDSAGSLYGKFGFLYQLVNLGEKEPSLNEMPILSTKSAGMLIKKDVYLMIGGMDEDFFIYNEEYDLCWRVWKSGNSVFLCPDSVVYHYSGGTRQSNPKGFLPQLYYQGTKNYILTIFKNANKKTLITDGVIHFLSWLFIATGILLIRRSSYPAKFVYKGIFWNITNLPRICQKRKEIKKFSKRELPDYVKKKVPLKYYLRTFLHWSKVKSKVD